MDHFNFNKHDIDQIKKNGQTPEQIYSQLSLFHRGTPFVKLDHPCTVGDGIKRFSNEMAKQYIHLYETQGIKKKIIKFVPASGAATRMFKKLIYAYHTLPYGEKNHAFINSPAGDALTFFIKNCRRFAFYDELKASISKEKMSLKTLLAAQNFKTIFTHLLTEKYLNYPMRPKGLIQFHSYKDHARTAFEEHLIEAGGYARSHTNNCMLHFTVSPQHRQTFLSFLQDIQPVYEDQLDTRFDVSFSTQKINTNTIAVDSQNQPFRLSDGSLLFRPGGHGALINNLNLLDGDIVFIKNIDNVSHDHFITETIKWKKILCGYLIALQQQIFYFLNQLIRKPVTDALIIETTEFLKTELSCRLQKNFESAPVEKKQKTLIHLLDRPLRVCGMVPNTGEPGGGPFWTTNNENTPSLQIVEAAQIDINDNHQQSLLNQLTHFNPVDLICGIRNWQGELFDLSKYVDHQAIFISNKSENGRDLKALELPGLWNGAMAFWNTAFVEVPKITFNPVKEVTDLLQTAHQALY